MEHHDKNRELTNGINRGIFAAFSVCRAQPALSALSHRSGDDAASEVITARAVNGTIVTDT